MRKLSLPIAPSRIQALIAINITAVIFGSAALYGKLDVSPFYIVALRAGFAAATLFLLGFLKKDLRYPPRHLLPTVLVTGAMLALHWLTFFAAVQWAGVAIATLTFATFPLFTVLIESLHRKRKPHPAELAAATAIVIAVGLLVNPRSGHNSLIGAGAGLVSAIAYACFWHASKKLSAALSPINVSFYQNTVVALATVPFLFYATPMPVEASQWLWLALLGIVNTALMLQLYLYALRRLSAGACSGFVALEPVYAILFAALFFHEPLTLWVIASAALIIAASFTLLKLETPPPAVP